MKMRRRAFLAAGLGGLAGAMPFAEAYRVQVNSHALKVRGLRAPLRVAHLSDLHFGPYIRAGSVRRWVDATLRARPDLIVVTGDWVDTRAEGDLTPLFAELARLKAPLGVWGVWGNHDYGSFGAVRRAGRQSELERLERFGGRLAQLGIGLLRNEGAYVRPDVFLCGVDDLWWGEPDLKAALRGAREGATLLMSHNPDVLPQVPMKVALTLCGHTHGGQVRLPLVGALTTASRYGERFAQGFVRGPALGFVSRGLGVSGLPVRLNCAAEIVLLNLAPA